jgi:hypothetical protein
MGETTLEEVSLNWIVTGVSPEVIFEDIDAATGVTYRKIIVPDPPLPEVPVANPLPVPFTPVNVDAPDWPPHAYSLFAPVMEERNAVPFIPVVAVPLLPAPPPPPP